MEEIMGQQVDIEYILKNPEKFKELAKLWYTKGWDDHRRQTVITLSDTYKKLDTATRLTNYMEKEIMVLRVRITKLEGELETEAETGGEEQ